MMLATVDDLVMDSLTVGMVVLKSKQHHMIQVHAHHKQPTATTGYESVLVILSFHHLVPNMHTYN